MVSIINYMEQQVIIQHALVEYVMERHSEKQEDGIVIIKVSFGRRIHGSYAVATGRMVPMQVCSTSTTTATAAPTVTSRSGLRFRSSLCSLERGIYSKNKIIN